MARAPRPRDRRQERGVTIVLVSASMVALLAITALAVDIGLGASRTRDLQQVADLVALDTTRVLTGGPAPAGSVIDAQVFASSARNDFPISGSFPNYSSGTRSMNLILGCWLDADGPTEPGLFEWTPGCAAPNAVRVRAEDDVDYRFADVIGIADGRFDRTATAAIVNTAGVGIGSVAAGLQTGLDQTNVGAQIDAYVQALNARLKASFGTDASLTPPPNGVGLDAVSYRGLAASNVTLGNLATAAGFGTPAELADATITNGELFEATAQALEAEGNDVAAASIRSFASSSTFDQDGTMRLGDGPLQFEQGTGTADDPGAARSRINVMDLLIGSATVVDGRNFVSYEITPAIPGVASVLVSTRVVEPMQYKPNALVGETAQTAQIRQQLTINLDSSLLGIPGTSFPLTLPIVIEGATGDATLTAIRCREPLELTETDIGAVTSLMRATIGVAQNLQAEGNPDLTISSATLIQAGPLSLETILYFGLNPLSLLLSSNVVGSGSVSLGGGSSTHTFLPESLPGPTPAQRSMGGVTGNLGQSLQSSMTIAGLPVLGVANLTSSLTSLFTDLGAGLIDPILHAAGITLGGADVLSDDASCNAPDLVG